MEGEIEKDERERDKKESRKRKIKKEERLYCNAWSRLG
jgi:hypothetical protein